METSGVNKQPPPVIETLLMCILNKKKCPGCEEKENDGEESEEDWLEVGRETRDKTRNNNNLRHESWEGAAHVTLHT